MNKNHITGPWGASSAQKQSHCTGSDMRQERSRMLGSWTSEVRNTERSLRAAKTGKKLGTRAEECKRTGVLYGWG